MSKAIDALGNRVNPDQLYVCLTQFAGDGIQFTIPRGARLRGSNFAVQKFPGFFVPDDTPDDEIPQQHMLGRR